MNKGLKRLAVGLLTTAVGASLVLAGCGQPTRTDKAGSDAVNQAQPVVGGTMVYTTIGDAKVLIPSLTTDTASSFVTSLVYDGLLVYNADIQLVPSLAREMPKVENDRTYTFELRDDVKWHDGEKLTSRDVLVTFWAIMHPKYTGVRTGDYTAIKGVKELQKAYADARKELEEKKIDEAAADAKMLAAFEEWKKTGGLQADGDYKVIVELDEPFSPFLGRFGTMGIMPAHLLEDKIGAGLKDTPEATKKPVGTGAYKLVEWVKDSHITLERNPDWKYGVQKKTNNIERMIVKVIPDVQASMVELETGETDVAVIMPEQFDHFKNEVSHVNIKEYQSFAYTFLGYNLKNPLFSDVRVRRAITHAINRQEIVDRLLLGHGTLAHSHGSPVRWDYNPDVPIYEYDVAKAEQLLAEAGWKKGADGILEKDGKKFSFKIATNVGNKLREQSAVIIQQALKKVGMDVKVEMMEWNAFLDYVDGEQKEAYILGWSLGYDPDVHSIWHSEGGYHMTHYYKNPRVDQLIEQGRKELDQAKRAEIYKEMQKILAEDQPYTWLYFPNTIAGINKRVMGVAEKVGPAGPFVTFEDWWLADTRAAQ